MPLHEVLLVNSLKIEILSQKRLSCRGVSLTLFAEMMNRRSALGWEDEGAGADAACSGTLAPAHYIDGLHILQFQTLSKLLAKMAADLCAP